MAFEGGTVMEDDEALAFDLQVQEAITASLIDSEAVEIEVSGDVLPPEIQREMLEHYHSQHELNTIRLDLKRQIHDRAFANEVNALPDAVWCRTGDHLERPFGDGASSSSSTKVSRFRVYVKGVAGNDSGGVGVAVCDLNDGLLFELSKGFSGKDFLANHPWMEFKAMMEGLEIAAMLDLSASTFITTSPLVHQYINGGAPRLTADMAALSVLINLLLRELSHVAVSLVADDAMKYAIELARKASAAKAMKLEGGSKKAMEIVNCSICLENTYLDQIFQIKACRHRYCFTCMSKHAQMKLLQGILPKCPYVNCKSELSLDGCKNFLTPEMLQVMRQRVKEVSIRPEDKVYCPNPKCSSLSSKTELQKAVHGLNNAEVGRGCRRCPECSVIFCLNCKAPWHQGMSCGEFQSKMSTLDSAEYNLKCLARNSLWRQCPKCNHMVSLSGGCNHIYCRCGHEFCYTCGAEWKKKKATCKCVLWDERYIIRR